MRSRSTRAIITIATTIIVLALVIIVAGKQVQRMLFERRVMAALAIDDLSSRIRAVADLRNAHRVETLTILIQTLDNSDSKIRARAASGMAMFQNEVGDAVKPLATHLQSSPYPEVRTSCAIVLMSTKSPAVREAYRRALHDSYDKVVEIACMELGDNSVPEDAEELYTVLDHPSWRVRLEICKTLILTKKADKRVVSTLEEMSNDPEAARYDAEIDEFDRMDKESGLPAEEGDRWGKLDTILQKAREVAGGG